MQEVVGSSPTSSTPTKPPLTRGFRRCGGGLEPAGGSTGFRHECLYSDGFARIQLDPCGFRLALSQHPAGPNMRSRTPQPLAQSAGRHLSGLTGALAPGSRPAGCLVSKGLLARSWRTRQPGPTALPLRTFDRTTIRMELGVFPLGRAWTCQGSIEHDEGPSKGHLNVSQPLPASRAQQRSSTQTCPVSDEAGRVRDISSGS
jgi:hypothetical protein